MAKNSCRLHFRVSLISPFRLNSRSSRAYRNTERLSPTFEDADTHGVSIYLIAVRIGKKSLPVVAVEVTDRKSEPRMA